jgi:hypothetical protein
MLISIEARPIPTSEEDQETVCEAVAADLTELWTQRSRALDQSGGREPTGYHGLHVWVLLCHAEPDEEDQESHVACVTSTIAGACRYIWGTDIGPEHFLQLTWTSPYNPNVYEAQDATGTYRYRLIREGVDAEDPAFWCQRRRRPVTEETP